MVAQILQFFVGDTGQEGEEPRKVRLVTKDSLATITTAGYLDNIVKSQGKNLLPTDEVHAWYGATSLAVPGTFAIFNPVISNSVITLNIWENPGNVLLPVVDGNFATYNGTAGQIDDSGYSPTDASKAKVAMLNAVPVVANNLVKFSATTGTISDAGARIISNTTAAYAGGGTSNAFTATGLTSASVGSAVIRASTNAVSIAKALPGTNTLTITFSADPGSGTTVDYIYSTAAQA